MSDKIESPNTSLRTQDHPPTQDPELPQTPPPSTATMTETTTTTPAMKYNNASFSMWPPTERTRDAVRNRLIETLSTPSILSKRYGAISREEAVDAAKRIEEEAFETVGAEATADNDGIEILQVYSKETSRRMLETVKSISGESEVPATQTANEAPVKVEEEEEEDAGSTAPPQSEKTESVADDE
ncbi:MFP1 attachment factor 1-like [Primulina huaijiensis]|uniref:MFP1 attachment factor 1-like n=1 Tax=Primulina huaijiensis TaxID=1492673 RepID=UPI003CC6E531